MKKPKRQVRVTALSREKKFRIVDANTGWVYQGDMLNGKPLFNLGPSPWTWPTREAAESFARSQKWEVV